MGLLAGSPQIVLVPISDLKPHPRNARKHSRAQIKAIGKSIDAFGFNAPVLADKDRNILAGHGRVEAAKHLGLSQVPIIFLHHLSDAEARAYMLADNKLTDRSTWDNATLAVQLKELSDLALSFDIDATGFELPEIDFRIQSLEETGSLDADDFGLADGQPVSVLGDIWNLGDHRILCASSLDPSALSCLFNDERASATFTDPPYNVRIDGHVSGKGAIRHREFPMATGEMSEDEFVAFLTGALSGICQHTVPGGLVYICMDWRHISEALTAGRSSGCELLNLCVWVKSNGGMGSLYRSRHELIFVFKNGSGSHLNNIQLGRFGRNRTNVWNYAGSNAFARKGTKRNRELHPTVKPVLLVADAIQDSTNRNDIIFDPFLGSGTTLLAAERVGRRCYGIELDPLYVDTAVERWQRMTGRKAHSHLGESFAFLRSRRSAAIG
nr:ParB N-terminal domain-containing protein [Bradyrhizobium sp. 6(2017)]